jgi:RsfA family transcription factor
MRGITPDWTQDDYDLLLTTVLEYLSGGYTLQDAFRKFEELTNGIRSISAARYKYVTKLSKQYAKEIEAAKAEGEKKRVERLLEQRANEEDENAVPRMTKRDLIRWLRNVELVSEDDEQLRKEVERLRAELEAAVKERDELRQRYEVLQQEYAQTKQELEQLLTAFNIARRHVAGLEHTSMRVVVGPDGVVQSVREEGR